MSIYINGLLLNSFTSPGGVDRSTGKSYDAQTKLQLQVEEHSSDGEIRFKLFDVPVPDPTPYQSMIGKSVNVPVALSVFKDKIFFKGLSVQPSKK